MFIVPKISSVNFQSRNPVLSNPSLPPEPSFLSAGGGGDSFIRQTDAINVARIKNLGIKNFRLVDSNSVRGQCLAHKPLELLTVLKDAGIETVVDFRSEGSTDSKFARNCRAAGLEYFNFKLKENMSIFNSLGNSREPFEQFRVTREIFVKDLDRFFKLMDRGCIYIGCLLGLHRTDLAVAMNYLLNPKEPQTPPSLSHMFHPEEQNLTNKRIGSVKNLLRNLTPEHRQFLGIVPELIDVFDARAVKLRLMNLK